MVQVAEGCHPQTLMAASGVWAPHATRTAPPHYATRHLMCSAGQVRFHIIGNARIKTVCKYQSCMVSDGRKNAVAAPSLRHFYKDVVIRAVN